MGDAVGSHRSFDDLHVALAERHRFLGHTEATIHLDSVLLDLLGKHPDDCSLADYEAVILRNKNAGTRAVYARRLRVIVTMLADVGAVTTTTHLKIPRLREPKRQPRPLTQDQVDKALASGPEPWRTMWHIAYLTGARSGELWAMEGQDLTYGRYGAELLIHGTGKKEWTIPCHPRAAAFIEEFGTLGRLWPQYGSPGALSSRASYELRRALKVPSSSGVNMHSLRHTFATRLLESTQNVVTVQKLLRHANIESTLIYVDVASSEQRDAILSLSA
jgi:integrase